MVLEYLACYLPIPPPALTWHPDERVLREGPAYLHRCPVPRHVGLALQVAVQRTHAAGVQPHHRGGTSGTTSSRRRRRSGTTCSGGGGGGCSECTGLRAAARGLCISEAAQLLQQERVRCAAGEAQGGQ